ncbi:MAG: alpha/beta hydrolase [bacterium]|nr:alpha/beta hydrolase [bacterium]
MPARPFTRALFALVFTCGILGGSMAAASLPPAAEEHLVDAGSYRLFFRIIRGEGPVILMEAGGGMHSGQWPDLMARVAAETGATVVSYDRPGFGQSDLPDIPCDMREESDSLWRALDKLNLDAEVILVGYSYGGWMTRLHANDHPDRVAGIVFIDPFNCEFVEALGVAYCDTHPMMGAGELAELPSDELTREQRANLRMMAEGLGPKVALMRETRVPEGIPVRLISSRQQFLPEAEEHAAWHAAHDRVVAAMPGAILVEATESNHGVPWQQPDLVMQAIADVVEAAAQH